MVRKLTERIIGRYAGKALTFVLVLFYVLQSAQVEPIHKAFHGPEVFVGHSPVQELDPCHLTVYHNLPKACAHDSHIIATDNCRLCDHAIHADSALVNAEGLASLQSSGEYGCQGESLCGRRTVLHSSRAPPALS